MKRLNERGLSNVSAKVLKRERREMKACQKTAAENRDFSGFRPQRSAVEAIERWCTSLVFPFHTDLRSVMQLSQDQIRSKAHLKIALQNASWYHSMSDTQFENICNKKEKLGYGSYCTP